MSMPSDKDSREHKKFVENTAGETAVRTVSDGGVASGGADSGEPVKIGFQARQTNPTAVDDADRVNAISDDLGRQIVILNHARDLIVDNPTTITSSTAETTVFTAVASTFLDLIFVMVANTSATDVRLDFRDTTAGTIRFSLFAPASQTTGFIPATPIKQSAVNTNWTAQSSASVADLRIFMQAVKNI